METEEEILDRKTIQWEKLRKKGKWYYAVIYGALPAVALYMVVPVVLDMITNAQFSWAETINRFTSALFFLRLLLFFVVGFVYGYIIWQIKEESYNRIKNK